MSELFIYNFGQIVGFFGLAFIVLAFQINDRTRIMRAQSISFFLYGIHYYLLGAYSGASLQVIGILRNYIFVKYRKKYSFAWLPIIFILIFVLAAILTWEGPISILPMSGMIMGVIAFWQEKTKIIRLINLVGPVLWFIYSYSISSYSGMLGMAFIFGSICIAILRYDILHKPEPSILKERLKLSD